MNGHALPPPEPGPDAAVAWVAQHLAHLVGDEPAASGRFRGGQTAADAALAGYDVSGYAATRNQVWPEGRRGASMLSPYIRHGLLALQRVWDHVAGGPARDVRKFRDELLWQEYARHLYGRVGVATQRSLRYRVTERDGGEDPWDRKMACLDLVVGELESDGWLVNQTRMWLASQWSVRHDAGWRAGEDRFFRHLLDGSRAANRLGWQWTVGALTGKQYGFSRWQVEKRAPGVCERCPLEDDCPISDWPPRRRLERAEQPAGMRGVDDLAADAGPERAEHHGAPEAVWLTAESLGDADPALAAHPELPAVFVFDEPLLAQLQLSAKRLVFLTETLADLTERRELRVYLGPPADVLRGVAVAVTFAPVPGFRRIAARVAPAVLHPWPWLRRPGTGPVTSFSAWRRGLGAGGAD